MRGTERKLFKLSKLSGYFAACAAVTAALVMIMPVQVKAQDLNLSNGDVTISTDGSYRIYQSDPSPTTNTISINCACTVSLDGVNILTKAPSSGMHTEDPVPNPINITGSYAVTIDLAAGTTNTLKSGKDISEKKYGSSGMAAIRVPSGATLTISGNGILNAYGADGRNSDNFSGSCNHGGGGAGIGGNGGLASTDGHSNQPFAEA